MNFIDFISYLLNIFGWTIFHSLWQGFILTLLFVGLIFLFRNYSVRIKYILSLFTLSLFLASSLVTFTILCSNNSEVLHESHTGNVTNVLENTNTADQNGAFYDIQNSVDPTKNKGTFSYHLKKLVPIVNKVTPFIAIIWLIGLIWFLYRSVMGLIGVRVNKRNPLNKGYLKWQSKVDRLCSSMEIRRKVKILLSPFVPGPVVFGLFKPVILFPVRLITRLSEEEIEAIILHELAHVLRHDYLVNLFQTLMESFFFYHPSVWWISQEIRSQREMICDEIASNYIDRPKLYINTLVKVEEYAIKQPKLSLAANGSKGQLFKRIKHLIERENVQKNISFLHPLAIPLIISMLLMFISASTLKHFNTNKESSLSHINLESHVHPYSGSIAIYSVGDDAYYHYNDSLCNQRYAPYSTFKVVSSLIALQTGIAADDSYTISYDSIKYPAEPWRLNQEPHKFWFRDQDLRTALQYSVNWFYWELNQKIGYENLETYLQQINYGNQDLSAGLKYFWLGGSLKISANEQVEFLKALYSKQLDGFSDLSQQITKEIMPNESTVNYKLYGKTGTGEISDDEIIGWYVGFLETDDNTYIFAMNMFVDGYDDLMNNSRQELTKRIFRDLNIIE